MASHNNLSFTFQKPNSGFISLFDSQDIFSIYTGRIKKDAIKKEPHPAIFTVSVAATRHEHLIRKLMSGSLFPQKRWKDTRFGGHKKIRTVRHTHCCLLIGRRG
jgi:hypothetical protein